MRLLHTSDWHLGRLFHHTHLTDDQAYVLDALVALAAQAKVDAVLVAGDVYDRAVPPAEAVELLDDVLCRLVLGARIPVVAIAGNHDSPERIGFGSRLLAHGGLHLVGPLGTATERVTLHDAHGPVQILAIPYAAPELVRERTKDARSLDHQSAMRVLLDRARSDLSPGSRSVLLAHAFVVGGESSDSERVLTVGGSGEVSADLFDGFDYVALGHLHRPQTVGRLTLRYSGSLLKYSFSEARHDKSVSLVELDAAGGVSVETVALRPRRDVRIVEGTLDELLARGQADAARDDYLCARLMDPRPVLNAMGRLRETYPNVLHIERPLIEAAAHGPGPVRDHRRLTTLDLFCDFYQQLVGEPLSEAQRPVVIAAIETAAPAAEERE